MITITPKDDQYQFKATEPGTGWRGWSVMCRNIKEVHQAIDHHYQHNKGHIEDKVRNCPICRSHRERSRKEAKSK